MTISEADAKILKRIQKRRDLAFEAWKDSREKQLADLEFCDPQNQWPAFERSRRIEQKRPCLTVDRTNPFIDQLVNDERQNRPAITVHPINDGADQETAEILQGYIRHIEMNSNADFAYDRASEAQKRCGFGFIRVLTDWVDPESFEQDIKIASVPNPFMYYLDPASMEPDGSDAKWGFGEEDILREDFEVQYPNAALAGSSANDWTSVGTNVPGWIGSDSRSLRIVEYYELESTPGTLCKLEDGTTQWKDELPEGAKIVQERPSNKMVLKWYKVCANEILDRRDCPGPWIPIVPIYGKELILNGERDHWGIVRSMKDVQRMINVWKSAQTEAIGLAPRAPWIVAMGALPDGDKTWNSANTTNYSALFYKAWDEEGRQMPIPARNVQEPAIQAITLALRDSEEDMKAVTGLYDPSRGTADGANQSGVAIKSLQRQGQVGNFHFADNFNRSLRHVGRIIIAWIPKIVDSERLLRCIGIDEKQFLVKVNTMDPVKDPKTGVERIYDLTAGKYDVSVVSGPSYTSRRQENADALMNLAKMVPVVGQLGADILVRQLDFPAAGELADRVTPPQFKKPDENQPQIPPQVQQQMQALSQQHEQLIQIVHKQAEQLESKDRDNETKIQTTAMQERTKLLIAIATLQGQAAQAQLEAEIGVLDSQADREHQMEMQAAVPAGGPPAGQPSPDAGEPAGMEQ